MSAATATGATFTDHNGRARPARTDSDRRIGAAQAATIAACEANRCPSCGGAVHLNLAITGWVQCDRYGSPGFRRDTTGPSCSWQGFLPTPPRRGAR